MKKTIHFILLVLIIVFISFYIINKWDFQLLEKISFNPAYLLVSFVLYSLHYFLVARLSHYLVSVKKKIDYSDYLVVYFISQLGRYVPGKIWMIVGKFEALRRKGFSVSWVTFSSFHEMMLMIVGAGLVSLASIPFLDLQHIGLDQDSKYIFLCLPILFLPMIKPAVSYSLNLIPKFLSKKWTIPSFIYPYSNKQIIFVSIGYSLSWCLQGIGFFLLAVSIFPKIGFSTLFFFSYAIAWIIGFLAVFSPSGIGVRESILIVLLSQQFNSSEAAILALSSRLAATIVEFSISFIIVVFSFSKEYFKKRVEK
ncbi:flippase-like domain-containing protein [bacterium]|nr:flippase-like domain-containing protein [bacterium]